MKRLVLLVVGAFAVAAALAFAVPQLQSVLGALTPRRQPWATVQGTVVDTDGRVPLAGVSVTCISRGPLSSGHREEVSTDAHGRFTLPILYRDFQIEVRKDGYVPLKLTRIPSDIREIELTRTKDG